VNAQVRDGKQWFPVDETLLVSWAEMDDLAEVDDDSEGTRGG
jgi:hypothetical protein